MAEGTDTRDPVTELLGGWGVPEPRGDFADRVVERARHAPEPLRRRRALRWALPFAFGTAFGGVLVASVMILSTGSSEHHGFDRPTHLQAPGVAEVVGEPGSSLQWLRDRRGRYAVDVIEGVAWVRRRSSDPSLVVLGAGEEVHVAGPCARIEVRRGWLSVAADVDEVDCAEVEAAIERAGAELLP